MAYRPHWRVVGESIIVAGMSTEDDKPSGLAHLSLRLHICFPDWSPARIGRFVGLNSRSVQRMFMGPAESKMPIPGRVKSLLLNTADVVDEARVRERILALIADLQNDNVPDDVIAAYLGHYDKKLTSDEESAR